MPGKLHRFTDGGPRRICCRTYIWHQPRQQAQAQQGRTKPPCGAAGFAAADPDEVVYDAESTEVPNDDKP